MSGSLSPRVLALCAAILFAWGATAAPTTAAHAQEGAKPGKPGAKKPPPKGAKGAKGAKGSKGSKGAKGKKKEGVGPFKKKDYPMSERLRPLVLPNAMGEVGLDLGIARQSTFGLGDPVTAVGLVGSFAYGIGDVGEIGVATGILLSPDVGFNNQILLHGHYLAYDSKDFDIAPGLLVPIFTVDGAPFGVVIDLPSRYVLSDGLFLRFGQGALPIGLSPDFSLSLVATGGVGYQINPRTVLFADLNVLNILVIPDFQASGLWEVLNLSLGAQYTPVREWDVGAALNLTNVWEAENSFGFGLNVYGRYRF
jgi:hypothetical protein